MKILFSERLIHREYPISFPPRLPIFISINYSDRTNMCFASSSLTSDPSSLTEKISDTEVLSKIDTSSSISSSLDENFSDTELFSQIDISQNASIPITDLRIRTTPPQTLKETPYSRIMIPSPP